MNLDSTLSGINSNSYVSLAEAVAYFDGHIYQSDWTNCTNKEYYLIISTRAVDSKNYKGTKFNINQNLKHPRDIGTLKNDIKEATLEQAIFLIKNPAREEHIMNKTDGITSISEAKTSVSYGQIKPLCYQAEEMLTKYFLNSIRWRI